MRTFGGEHDWPKRNLTMLHSGSGSEIWRKSLPETGTGPPTLCGGRIFFLSSNVLSAVDAADGNEIWTAETPAPYFYRAAPTVCSERVWMAGDWFGDAAVSGFHAATGNLQFLARFDQDSPAANLVSYYEGVLYVCASGAFVAIEPRLGLELWRYTPPIRS